MSIHAHLFCHFAADIEVNGTVHREQLPELWWILSPPTFDCAELHSTGSIIYDCSYLLMLWNWYTNIVVYRKPIQREFLSDIEDCCISYLHGTWWCKIILILFRDFLEHFWTWNDSNSSISYDYKWYLNLYHCDIYQQLPSSPSGVLVAWHLTSSYVVGRRPFHLKPAHTLGTDSEMNEDKQLKVSSPFRLSLCFYNTDT